MSKMPSLNGSRRRHAKQNSALRKSDPPPALCLSSRSSTSSKSSDTQDTPRSIFHSSLRPSRRSNKDVRSIARQELMEPQVVSPAEEKGKVDVFAFMERDDDAWNTPTIQHTPQEPEPSDEDEGDSPRVVTAQGVKASQMSPRYSDLEVRAIQDGVQRAWGRASSSLHSDSGISVHSGSPEQESPIMQHKYPMIQEDVSDNLESSLENDDEPPVAELRDSPNFSANQGMLMHRHHQWSSNERRRSQPDHPQTCHVSPQARPHEGSFVPSLEAHKMPSRPVRDLVHRRTRQHHQRSKVERTTGYDKLASSISFHRDSDAVLKPIYRKFETLNNRMLLYLQDEISEIEEQLQELDAAIAQEEAQTGKGPSSRRAEAKLPSQLQWHRMELLGRSFAKIEQYNRALTSYTKLIRTVSPAATADISAYKSWIAAHTPIDRAETAFLDKTDDLLSIFPLPTPSPTPVALQQQTALDSPTLVLAFAFVATIIVFKVVPQILARLVISAVVGGAVLCLLSPKGGWRGLRQWRRGIGLYSAVMLVLAVVVS